MSDEKGKVETPSIGVSLNAQFASGRALVFQTHVPQSITVDGINAILDKFNSSVDRAEAFYKIEELENSLERDKQILYSIQHNMQEVEANMAAKYEASGRRQPFKMSPQEVVQKKQAQDNVVRQTEIVKLSERRLAEAREKAGNRDGAPSPANN